MTRKRVSSNATSRSIKLFGAIIPNHSCLNIKSEQSENLQVSSHLCRDQCDQDAFWASVAYGLLAPPLIVIILRVCNDRRVMGEHKNGRLLNVAGVFAAVVMSAAALAALVAWWTR